MLQILPEMEGKRGSDRSVKGLLVLSLGEFVADTAWPKLKELVTNLNVVQDDLDSKDGVKIRREGIRSIAGEIAEQLIRMAGSSESSVWQQSGSLADLVINEEHKERLVQVLSAEIVRALRRRPTRRAFIYELFLESYIRRAMAKLAGSRGDISSEQLHRGS